MKPATTILLMAAFAKGTEAGDLSLRPSGFLEVIGVSRSAGTGRTAGTRFGSIPLAGSTFRETMASLGHSRLALDVDRRLGSGQLAGYVECDFLAGPQDHVLRFRQYYVQYSTGKWEIATGKQWSLIRPNRIGISSRENVLSTLVADPSYHVGLAGLRNRQIRVAVQEGKWHIAAAFEDGRDLVAKAAHDGERLHWEASAVAGGNGHRGGGVSAYWRVTSRVMLSGQQFSARGGGKYALGTAPGWVKADSMLGGVEVKLKPPWQVFGYYGTVVAAKSPQNRNVREWTAGCVRELLADRLGRMQFTAQYSRLGRSVWDGQKGEIGMWMAAVRHTWGERRN
ncbi:MAG: hypothetical protein HY235_07180 [Acidobacteria bacterium]|nr:hypothetical protein [Acidobacteriota bacterium]